MNYVNHELHGINRQYLLTNYVVNDKVQLGSKPYQIDFLEVMASSPIFEADNASGFMGLGSNN